MIRRVSLHSTWKAEWYRVMFVSRIRKYWWSSMLQLWTIRHISSRQLWCGSEIGSMLRAVQAWYTRPQAGLLRLATLRKQSDFSLVISRIHISKPHLPRLGTGNASCRGSHRQFRHNWVHYNPIWSVPYGMMSLLGRNKYRWGFIEWKTISFSNPTRPHELVTIYPWFLCLRSRVSL